VKPDETAGVSVIPNKDEWGLEEQKKKEQDILDEFKEGGEEEE